MSRPQPSLSRQPRADTGIHEQVVKAANTKTPAPAASGGAGGDGAGDPAARQTEAAAVFRDGAAYPAGTA